MTEKKKPITCNGLAQYVESAKGYGQTQTDIAYKAGIDKSAFSRILSGKRGPSSTEMAKLCLVFNANLSDLFEVNRN